MSKTYFNSHSIREILDQVKVREQFKAAGTLIQFPHDEPYKEPRLEIIYTDIIHSEPAKNDTFIQAVLNHLLFNKDYAYQIDLTGLTTLVIYSNNEAIILTQSTNNKDTYNSSLKCEYLPDFRPFLADYPNKELILKQHEEFLIKTGFVDQLIDYFSNRTTFKFK